MNNLIAAFLLTTSVAFGVASTAYALSCAQPDGETLFLRLTSVDGVAPESVRTGRASLNAIEGSIQLSTADYQGTFDAAP